MIGRRGWVTGKTAERSGENAKRGAVGRRVPGISRVRQIVQARLVRTKPRAIRPRPTTAMDAGSGTGAAV